MKKNKKDYLLNDLPSNRKEVFFDILKLRFDLIIKNGVVLFLFMIPLILVTISFNISVFSLKDNLENNLIDLKMYQQSLSSIYMIYSFLQVLALLVLSIAFSGTLRIIKRVVFYESIQFKDDFLLGIKTNFKPTFLTFLIIGIIYFLCRMLLLNIFIDNSSKITYYINYLPIVLSVFILYPILMLLLCQIPIYNNSYKVFFKNSIYFYGKSIFKTLIIAISLLVPYLIFLINNIYVLLIFTIIIVLIILPIEILLFFIYSCSVFDKHLNVYQFKEIYDKGIYRKNKH